MTKISKKQEILQIANKLFAKIGYHATTYQKIAEEANIAKSSVFFHFKTKEILGYEAIHSLIRLINYKISTHIMSFSNNYYERKDNFVKSLPSIISEFPELSAPLFMSQLESELISQAVKDYIITWKNILDNLGDTNWSENTLIRLKGSLLNLPL